MFSTSPKPWQPCHFYLTSTQPFAPHHSSHKTTPHGPPPKLFSLFPCRRLGKATNESCKLLSLPRQPGLYVRLSWEMSLRGTWPWDHPPVVGSNDMPTQFVAGKKNKFGSHQPWKHEGQQMNRFFLGGFIGEGSKSKIEQKKLHTTFDQFAMPRLKTLLYAMFHLYQWDPSCISKNTHRDLQT